MFCYSIFIFTDLKSRPSLYFCLKTGSPLGTVGFQVWIEARFKVSALLWHLFFPSFYFCPLIFHLLSSLSLFSLRPSLLSALSLLCFIFSDFLRFGGIVSPLSLMLCCLIPDTEEMISPYWGLVHTHTHTHVGILINTFFLASCLNNIPVRTNHIIT